MSKRNPSTPYAVRTQAEVGRMLGLTQVEVSEIERKALRKLWFALKEVAEEAGYDVSKPPVAPKHQAHLGRQKKMEK
jgi:hypothetical protein